MLRREGRRRVRLQALRHTGEKIFEEIFKTNHAVVRTTKRTVQVNYTFSRDLDKQDMLRYLKAEHKELIAGFKEADIKG